MKLKLDSLPPFKGDAELSKDAVLIKKKKISLLQCQKVI